MGFVDKIKTMVNDYKEKCKVSIKCPNCGANVECYSYEQSATCEFCGNLVNNDEYSLFGLKQNADKSEKDE